MTKGKNGKRMVTLVMMVLTCFALSTAAFATEADGVEVTENHYVEEATTEYEIQPFALRERQRTVFNQTNCQSWSFESYGQVKQGNVGGYVISLGWTKNWTVPYWGLQRSSHAEISNKKGYAYGRYAVTWQNGIWVDAYPSPWNNQYVHVY